MKRVLAAFCAWLLAFAPALAQFNGQSGIYALNHMTFGIMGPFSITAGGQGYSVNDTITLDCGDIYVTGTRPVITITSATGPGAITGISLSNAGTATQIPSTGLAGGANGVCTFTQFSTSGAGSGAQIFGAFGFIAAYPAFLQLASPLPVGSGGTGRTTFTANLPLIGNGAGGINQGQVAGNTTTFLTADGSLTTGNCVQSDSAGGIVDAGAPCGTGSGGGNITLGTSTITGPGATSGYFIYNNAGVAGNTNAIPAADITGTLGVAHGGSGATTLGSGLPLFGAGTSPFTTGTLSGNTTKLGTTNGTLTSGHCVSIDGSGNLVDAGGACTTGSGGGTVASSSIGQVAVYTGATTVTGDASPLTVAVGGTGAATLSSGKPLFGAGTSPITAGTLSGNTTELATITGSLTNGDCAKFDASGNVIDAGAACGTLTGTVAVASGGTGDTTLASGKPLLGAGTSPVTTGTLSGNTTEFATATGTLTSGHCVSIDASGNFVDAGGACTTGSGGGTVASSTVGTMAVYTGSTTVTGTCCAAGVVTSLNDGLNISGGLQTYNYTAPGTGAVAQNVPSKLNGAFINCQTDFGATGDGSTDDTTAIQHCITQAESVAATEGVATAYLPTGQYLISSCLSVTNSIHLIGDGTDRTVFLQSTAADAGICISTTDYTSITFEHFGVDYSVTPNSGTFGITVTGLSGTPNQNTIFRDIAVNDAYSGVQLAQSAFFIMENVFVTPYTLYGIEVSDNGTPDTGDGVITNCNLWASFSGIVSGSAGVHYLSGGGLRITNSKFTANTNAILFNLASGAATDQLIIANNSFDTDTTGILMERSGTTSATSFAEVSIIGNIFNAITNPISVPADANNIWLTNVVISGNNIVLSGTNPVGISLNGTAMSDAAVSNNTILTFSSGSTGVQSTAAKTNLCGNVTAGSSYSTTYSNTGTGSGTCGNL